MKFLRFLPAFLSILAVTGFSPVLRADDAAQRTALVEEMLKTMRMDETMANIMVKQKQAVLRMSASMLPKDTPAEEQQKFQQMLPKIMDAAFKQMSWETLKPDFVRIYAEVFTVADIKGLIAFYQSPVGQKFIEKQPEVTEKTMMVVQQRMPAMMQELQKLIQENAQQIQSPAKSK